MKTEERKINSEIYRFRHLCPQLLIGAIIILLAAFTLNIYGEERAGLVGDRPDFTESAQTVPYQVVQLETGYTYTGTRNTDEHTLGELLIRVGLWRPCELRLGINSYVWNENDDGSKSGKDEGYIGFKLQLMKSAGSFRLMKPSLAFMADTTLPSGSDVSVNDYEPEATIAIAWPIARSVELGTNLSWSALSDNGERFARYSASIAVGISVTSRISMYGEYFGFYPDYRDSDGSHYIDGGLTCLITDTFQLDFRAGTTVAGPREEYFIGAGAVALWTKLF